MNFRYRSYELYELWTKKFISCMNFKLWKNPFLVILKINVNFQEKRECYLPPWFWIKEGTKKLILGLKLIFSPYFHKSQCSSLKMNAWRFHNKNKKKSTKLTKPWTSKTPLLQRSRNSLVGYNFSGVIFLLEG